jgi:hypothetical protein
VATRIQDAVILPDELVLGIFANSRELLVGIDDRAARIGYRDDRHLV